ncbi:MAG: serine protease [Bacteroidaceae bacterium]|nr:serine protease [Bacteroidaceae bacterium]
MYDWYNSLDPALRIYWGVAIFASVIFVIQTVMSFVGIGDMDTDASVDVDPSPDAMDDAGAMHLLSIRNIVYFLLGVGWTGVSLWNTIDNRIVLALIAVAVGCLFVAIFLFLFRQMMKLQHNGAFDINDAVGKTVDVYLRIPAAGQGMGKVQVSFNGSIQELDARTDSSAMIPSGAKVRVIDVIDRSVLIVAPLND